MSVRQVARRVFAEVAPAPNRLRMFRATPLNVFFLLFWAVIGLFPNSALGCLNVQILLGGSNGNDITGMTESRYVGQQTVLYAQYALPSGVSATGQSWSVDGTTVGGFTSGAIGGPLPTQFNQQSTTFYWTVPANSQTVTFTLNLNDGETATAQATFNVAGPTSPSVTTPLGNWQESSGPSLQLGSNLSGVTPGITFNGSAATPPGDSGTYEWGQIISTFSGTATSGLTKYNCSTTTGLDTRFPYDTALTPAPQDSPFINLVSSSFSGQTFSFGATMYFMWNPETSSNDIPVPLGYVTWQAYGDATYSNNNWTIQSDSSRSAGSFQASSSYPSWTSVFNASNGLTCQ